MAMRFGCFILACFATFDALAFIDQPVFSPQPIRANESATVSYRKGGCDFFPSVTFPIEFFRVEPNRIQLYVTGIHQTDPILCLAGISTHSFNLPLLEAGEYQLELYIRNRANPAIPIHNGPVAAFSVVAAAGAPVPVPGLNIFGIVALIFGFAVVSVYAVRRSS
jgi:hypothetical protein